MPVTLAAMLRQRIELTPALLLAFVTCSQIGFLGYYTEAGFHEVPTGLVLGAMLLLGMAGFATAPAAFLAAARRLWPMLLLMVWAAVSSLHSELMAVAMRRSAMIFIPGILLAVTAAADPQPRLSLYRTTCLFVLLSLASLAFSLLAIGLGKSAYTHGGQLILRLWDGPLAPGIMLGGRKIDALGFSLARPSGLFSNPNGAAIVTVIGMALLSLLPAFGRSSKMSKGLLMLALIVAFLLGGSRGSVLLIVVFAAALACLRRRWTAPALCLLALVVALPAIIIAMLAAGMLGDAPPMHQPVDLTSFAIRFEAFHLRERLDVWKVGYAAIPAFWLRGAGFGMVQELVMAPAGLTSSAHSVPMSILLETGAVGFLLMQLAWFRLVLPVFRSQHPPTLLAGLAAILVGLYASQTFDSSVFRFHPLHFLFCYVIGAIANPALAAPEGRE